MATYEVWIDGPRGERYALLDSVLEIQYSQVLNWPGYFSMTLAGDFDVSLLHVDNVVEIWRTVKGSRPILDFVGFMRRIKWYNDASGTPYVEAAGWQVNELLKRRIMVMYSQEPETAKTDYADDMMKAMVSEQMSTLATDGYRDMSGEGLTVADDYSLGPEISKSFAWRNLLDALRDVAEASYQAGKKLFFDLVTSWDDRGRLLLKFETFIDQRGLDRTYTSGQPAFFGEAWGNLAEGEYEEDYSEEINYVYAGGQGVASARMVVEVEDTEREAMSPWNRREVFADARNESETAGVTGKGNTMLAMGRPAKRFKAKLLDTEQFRYGRDWNFGDRVSCEFRGQWFEAMIRAATVYVKSDGSESIDVRVESE